MVEDRTSLGNYGGMMGGYGASSLGNRPVNGGYGSPGWQRAQAFHEQQSRGGSGGAWPAGRGKPPMIEGELVASSSAKSDYSRGDRVFHDKFGYGLITSIDGNKLMVDFEKAGAKHVVPPS